MMLELSLPASVKTYDESLPYCERVRADQDAAVLYLRDGHTYLKV